MSGISAATRWKLSSSQSAAGGHELAGADVVGERAVGGAQDAGVVVEARKGCLAARRRGFGIEGEAGGERQRALFEPLDAEQLVAKRFQNLRTRPERRPHDAVATCAPRTVDTTVERSRQSPRRREAQRSQRDGNR